MSPSARPRGVRQPIATCAVLAAVAVVWAAGCGSCKEDEPVDDPPERRSLRDPAPAAPKRLQSPTLDTKRSAPSLGASTAPVTVDEAREALPTPEGARVLTEPEASAGGPQIKSTVCFDGVDIDGATAELKKSLMHAGWTEIHHRASGGRHDRVTMSAQKPPYRLNARLMLGNWDGCRRTDSQVYASMTLHKLRERPAGGE